MFVSSGRAQVAYDVVGDATGHDVLLIHAGVTDRRSWESTIARLAPRHRCVAFDQRGYGETTYEREDGWSPVDDAVAVLDAVGVDRAVVVACSMGGRRGIDLTLAHPDRVAGLVLIGTAVGGAPWPEIDDPAVLELVQRAEAAEEAGDLDLQNRLEAWMWLDGPTSDEGRVQGAVRDLFLEMNAKALSAADPGDQSEPPDAWLRLADVAVPTLVMIGRLDMPEIVAVDEQLAGLVPGARLLWLDGVAHLPHLEGDQVCLDALADFVDLIPSDARRS